MEVTDVTSEEGKVVGISWPLKRARTKNKAKQNSIKFI
jgi:hypothetical protein